MVSIHAPRAGRDSCFARGAQRTSRFNPRAPCGARQSYKRDGAVIKKFQSTRPVRGATSFPPYGVLFFLGFIPRAPCGARLSPCGTTFSVLHFQSTRPVRGATYVLRFSLYNGRFQSTRPVRGATFGLVYGIIFSAFQSTRPVRGATPCGGVILSQSRCFNPRAPCGARRLLQCTPSLTLTVSIHAPRAGRDCVPHADSPAQSRFNPRAPCGARPLASSRVHLRVSFQSTRPVRGATDICDFLYII